MVIRFLCSLGMTIHPEHAISPNKPGRKIAVVSSCNDASSIAGIAQGADLLVHDASLFVNRSPPQRDNLVPNAAALAAAINARCLLLTNLHMPPDQLEQNDICRGAMPGSSSPGPEDHASSQVDAKATTNEIAAQVCKVYNGHVYLASDFHSHVLEKHEGPDLRRCN